MAGKRKRSRPGQRSEGFAKRQRVSGAPSSCRNHPVVKHALLTQYYPQVLSLREYLLSKLPPASKIRRKKILSVGRKPGREISERDQALADALDRTLIGVSRHGVVSHDERRHAWTSYSQRLDTSASNFANATGVEVFSQSEVSVYVFSPRDLGRGCPF
jgi:telomerase reverse transcriptase